MYSREIIADVLAANDIVDVIGAAVDLKSAGSGRYKGLCPFHQEKTPSFSVNRDRQFFYCFGCGKSGDALRFLQEFEGLPFTDALRRLADRGGVRLPALSERDNKEEFARQQLLDLGKRGMQYFRKMLADPRHGGHAQEYLAGRALRDETIRRFGLGYAPKDWDSLVTALQEAGISPQVQEASGLVRRNDRGTKYAFFRDRLMIPIRDLAGNVVAFGGRDLSGADNVAKYVNTPENSVYKKSRMLFGLYEAREALRAEKRALLVEGYFDLMRCFDNGLEWVVAPCGTALTLDQAKLLRRYVEEVIVVFDGDAAGVRAALRSVGILTNAGLTVRALLLPDGQDPDDYIRAHGVESFRQAVDSALDFVRFYVAMNESQLETIEGRTEVARDLFDILLGVDDVMRRQEYVKEIAQVLHLDAWAVRREFEQVAVDAARRKTIYTAEKAAEHETAPVYVNRDDCEFVSALLHSPALRSQVQQALTRIMMKPGPLDDVLNLVLDTSTEKADLDAEAARALYAAAVNLEPMAAAKAEDVVQKRIKRLEDDSVFAEMEALRNEKRLQNNENDDAATVLNQMIEAKRKREQIGPF